MRDNSQHSVRLGRVISRKALSPARSESGPVGGIVQNRIRKWGSNLAGLRWSRRQIGAPWKPDESNVKCRAVPLPGNDIVISGTPGFTSEWKSD